MPGKAAQAIFLDRDGVINEHPGDAYYVKDSRAFRILPGVLEACRNLKKAGFGLWVLSNQSGIATGRIRPVDLEEITRGMKEAFSKSGAELNGVLYCPHQDSDRCDCRKPRHGLYDQVSRIASIDFKSSVTIGDAERDLVAGRAAGCKTVLVLTGRTASAEVAQFKEKPDAIHNDLKSAAAWILNPIKF